MRYVLRHDEPGGPSCVVLDTADGRIVAYCDTQDDAQLVADALVQQALMATTDHRDALTQLISNALWKRPYETNQDKGEAAIDALRSAGWSIVKLRKVAWVGAWPVYVIEEGEA